MYMGACIVIGWIIQCTKITVNPLFKVLWVFWYTLMKFNRNDMQKYRFKRTVYSTKYEHCVCLFFSWLFSRAHCIHVFLFIFTIQGLYSLRKCRLTGIGITIINLRRSDDRLRFIMGIPTLIRRRLLSEWIEARGCYFGTEASILIGTKPQQNTTRYE